MPHLTEAAVTLPIRVLVRLRRVARRTGMPLEWVVAAFIAELRDEPTVTRAA